MSQVRIGQLWREKETALHRKWGAEVRTVRVFEMLADGRVRVRKVSGSGFKQTSTMQSERLTEKYELLPDPAPRRTRLHTTLLG